MSGLESEFSGHPVLGDEVRGSEGSARGGLAKRYDSVEDVAAVLEGMGYDPNSHFPPNTQRAGHIALDGVTNPEAVQRAIEDTAGDGV